MKQLLLLILFLNFSFGADAQDTYFIDWSFNSDPNAAGAANANRTIEAGDTVTWNWYANGTHSVVSEPNAAESFDSGLLGPGSTFSYTFTQVGTNDYICGPHPNNMFGTITVVPDGSLNTSDFLVNENVSLYPNPAKDVVYLELSNTISANLSVSIFNALGQEVKRVELEFDKNEPISISELNSGLYFIKISSSNDSITKRLIIK